MGIATGESGGGGEGERASNVATTGELVGDLRRARLEIGAAANSDEFEIDRRSRRRAALSSCSAEGLRPTVWVEESFGDVEVD
jgi:hypothetical protein